MSNGSRHRTGCFNCKRRKRRCDEQKPTCYSCHKRGVACVFPDTNPVHSLRFVISVAGDHPTLKLKKTERPSYIHLRSDDVARISREYRTAGGGCPEEKQWALIDARFRLATPLLAPLSQLRFSSKSLETQLVQYYCEVVTKSRVFTPTGKNCFRDKVMPLVLCGSGPTFFTVLSLSSAELSRTANECSKYHLASVRYKAKALGQLRSQLAEAGKANENLLTCLLQATADIADGLQPTWLNHLKGAVAILEKFGDLLNAHVARFVAQYFHFRYTLMKTTRRDASLSDPNPDMPLETKSEDAVADDLARILKSLLTTSLEKTPDEHLGCTLELVDLISRITSASSTHGSTPQSPSSQLKMEMESERLDCELRDLQFGNITDEYLLESCECFRTAAHIYLRLACLKKPISDGSIRFLLGELLRRLANAIHERHPRRSFPMWPLFIAGCVSFLDKDRKAVLSLFTIVDSQWPLSNISVVWKALWTIWQSRDFSSSAPEGKPLDWQEVITEFGWKLSLS